MHTIATLLTALVLVAGSAATSAAGSGAAAAGKDQGRFLGAMPTTYPAWFKESFLDFHDDIAEAAAAGRRVAVLFHQDGCPYCNALVERNLAQKDIEAFVREHFDVVALNMWGDREVVSVDGRRYTEKELAAVLRVQFTPTILFFDEQAQLALRLDGYLPPRRFKLALRYATGERQGHDSLRAYLAANLGTDGGGDGALNTQPYFQPPPHDLQSGRSGKPFVVLFEQRECPNCDTLHERVLSLPETARLAGGLHVVQLDMWSDTPLVTPAGERTTARAWADELGLSYAPSLVLFDAEGNEVLRSDAWFKRFHTQSMLDYLASGAHRQQPSFQRYISARAEHLREQGQDVDIWD